MKLYNKIKGLVSKNKAISLQGDLSLQSLFEPISIPVADIKSYVVRNFEEVRDLKNKNEELMAQLEESNKVRHEYEISLVTLQEYSDRLRKADAVIETLKGDKERLRQDIAALKEKVATYQIKEVRTAEQIREISDEKIRNAVSSLKEAIIENINNHRGNLSKASAVILVENTCIDGEDDYIE